MRPKYRRERGGNIGKSNTIKTTTMKTFRKGDIDPEICRLQRVLYLVADGCFGSLTEEAVKKFQREHNLAADGVVGPKTWEVLLAVEATQSGDPQLPKLKKTIRPIKRIIVHCTATREGQDVSVADIDKMHRQQGWTRIGYHYVVLLDGTVQAGRDVDFIGANCEGYNTTSIGVVYVGGLAKDGKTPKDTRTEAQKKGLRKIVRELQKLYPKATVHGHREFAAKDCPCFDVRKEL